MWGIPEKNYQKLAQQCKLDHSNMLPAHEMTKCLFFQMLIFSNVDFFKLLIFPNFTLMYCPIDQSKNQAKCKSSLVKYDHTRLYNAPTGGAAKGSAQNESKVMGASL